jgi:hypothetical protein
MPLVALHEHLQEGLVVESSLLVLLGDVQRAVFSVPRLVLADPFQQEFDDRGGKIESAQVEFGDVRLWEKGEGSAVCNERQGTTSSAER